MEGESTSKVFDNWLLFNHVLPVFPSWFIQDLCSQPWSLSFQAFIENSRLSFLLEVLYIVTVQDTRGESPKYEKGNRKFPCPDQKCSAFLIRDVQSVFLTIRLYWKQLLYLIRRWYLVLTFLIYLFFFFLGESMSEMQNVFQGAVLLTGEEWIVS